VPPLALAAPALEDPPLAAPARGDPGVPALGVPGVPALGVPGVPALGDPTLEDPSLGALISKAARGLLTHLCWQVLGHFR